MEKVNIRKFYQILPHKAIKINIDMHKNYILKKDINKLHTKTLDLKNKTNSYFFFYKDL